jgi:hypothetical protein
MNLNKLMKQAQEMQQKMAQLQEELGHKEVEAASGGGMVRVKMNGRQEVLGVQIDPQVFADADREMLEDLVTAAFNEARRMSLELAKEEMSKLTGGLPVPGLF